MQTLEETPLRLAGVIRESIVDGPGIRMVVFAQGCPHTARAATTRKPTTRREDMTLRWATSCGKQRKIPFSRG